MKRTKSILISIKRNMNVIVFKKAYLFPNLWFISVLGNRSRGAGVLKKIYRDMETEASEPGKSEQVKNGSREQKARSQPFF
jgi:hypothetical protein